MEPAGKPITPTRQFVDGKLVLGIPTVFFQLGPICIPMSLTVAERVQAELFAVIEELRVWTRAQTEKN